MKLEETLAAAAAESCESWVSRQTAGYDPEEKHDFTPAFEKRLRRLRRRADHPALYPVLRRAAAVVLALLLAGAVLLAVDEEARAAVFGWIGVREEGYYSYRHEGGKTEDAEMGDFRPTWLPEGYAEYKVRIFNEKTTVLYQNDREELLRFSYLRQSNTEWSISTVGTEIYETEVNGYPATFLRSTVETVASVITWVGDGEVVFFISGFVSDGDLMKMAESVERTP